MKLGGDDSWTKNKQGDINRTEREHQDCLGTDLIVMTWTGENLLLEVVEVVEVEEEEEVEM